MAESVRPPRRKIALVLEAEAFGRLVAEGLAAVRPIVAPEDAAMLEPFPADAVVIGVTWEPTTSLYNIFLVSEDERWPQCPMGAIPYRVWLK